MSHDPEPRDAMSETDGMLAGLAEQIDAVANRMRMVNGSVAVAIRFDSEAKRAEVVALLRTLRASARPSR